MKYEPRYYQREAVDACWSYIERNPGKNPCIVLPTGSGKSLTLSLLIRDAVQEWQGRVLLLSHVKELLTQSKDHIEAVAPDLAGAIGVYSAGLRRRDKDHPVIVAGIQSVHSKACELGRFDVIIVDEAHTIPDSGDGMYRSFLEEARIVNPAVVLVGLTATPYRMKTGYICGPDNLLNEICYEISVKKLIDEGFLCNLISKAGVVKADLSGVHVRGGEYVSEELEDAMDTDALVSAACREIVECTHNRRSNLVFASGVKHGGHIAQAIRGHGESVAEVYGETPGKERDEVLKDFKAGKIKHIVSVGVLTTGFDARNIDCISMLRPTMSPGLFYQMCIDSKTEILTRRGWLGIDEIEQGDHVAAANTSEEVPVLQWELPQEIINRSVAPGEKMVSIQSPTVDIRVTESHDMIVTGRKSDEGWKKELAIETAKRKGDYRIPAACEERTTGIALTDYELKFIGWFLTDGYYNPMNNAIYISQSTIQPHFKEVELMLVGCGFKYGKRLITAKTQFNESAPRYMFSISKGEPRGRDKHLSGWGRLEPYIDKNLSPALEQIDSRQLGVLLEAIHLGDGSKQLGQYWTRRSYHIASANKKFADRLQALCVRHGWRCNVSHSISMSGNILYNIHAKHEHFRAMGGSGQADRKSLVVSDAEPGERVWCVKVNSGAFIARRNGKAFITGNCGRGLRINDGKENCLILDFSSNILTHGPVDQIRVKPKKLGEPGQAPVKECPDCHGIIHAALTECPHCGHIFGREPNHEQEASFAAPVSGQNRTEVRQVYTVRYSKHVNRKEPEKPPTMRVEYQTGVGLAPDSVSEWICIEHEGWARQKAAAWWSMRSVVACPASVDAAVTLANAGALAPCEAVTVAIIAGEKWPKIVGYKLGARPEYSTPETGWATFEEVEAFEGKAEPAKAPEHPITLQLVTLFNGSTVQRRTAADLVGSPDTWLAGANGHFDAEGRWRAPKEEKPKRRPGDMEGLPW